MSDDPVDLALRLHRLITEHEQAIALLTPLRRVAFRTALHADPGLSMAELGRRCGLSRARVSALVRRAVENGTREPTTTAETPEPVAADVPPAPPVAGVGRIPPPVGAGPAAPPATLTIPAAPQVLREGGNP